MTAGMSLLGMARKAGAVVIGEEPVTEAVLDHKVRLVLVASDAGETTADRISRLESDKLPVLLLKEEKQELGAAVGFAKVAVAGICDLGFAAAIAAKLGEEDPRAKIISEGLAQRQKKARRRKAETAKFGKKSKRRK